MKDSKPRHVLLACSHVSHAICERDVCRSPEGHLMRSLSAL